MNILPGSRTAVATATLWCVLLLCSACTVQFISDYDEQTDKAVTALQRKTERHLAALQRNAQPGKCEYGRFEKFYEEAQVDASAIVVRAEALPRNTLTTQQARLLAENFTLLEARHRAGCLHPDEITPLRATFNAGFTAILKLEFEKKRVGN